MDEPTFDIAAAIKERVPASDQGIALLLSASQRLGRLLESDLHDTVRARGLDRSEYEVATILWFTGSGHPLSPTQLSYAVLQTTSGLTKTLRRLETKGLVERLPDPADGRGRLARLTSSGTRMVEALSEEFLEEWQARLEGYSTAQVGKLGKALWSFVNLVEDSFSR
jgi:DNA-binding MarR family transcriptional regulator